MVAIVEQAYQTNLNNWFEKFVLDSFNSITEDNVLKLTNSPKIDELVNRGEAIAFFNQHEKQVCDFIIESHSKIYGGNADLLMAIACYNGLEKVLCLDDMKYKAIKLIIQMCAIYSLAYRFNHQHWRRTLKLV